MNDVEKKVEEFQIFVNKYFDFLIKTFKFKKEEIKKIDFDYPQDKKVEITFTNSNVMILVTWYIAYCYIEVALVEMIKKKKPEKYSFYGDIGYARGISLSDLVEVITDGKLKSPLLKTFLGAKNSEVIKKWRERDELINSSLDDIIAWYAKVLKRYGIDIINGNFTIFEKVQDFAKSKIPSEN